MKKSRIVKPISKPGAAEERAIKAGIAADADTYELSKAEFAQLKPVGVGRPKSANAKVQVTLRLDPGVVAFFRSSGSGWQTRIHTVLIKHVARQNR